MTDDRARIREYYDSLSASYEELYGKEQAKKHKEVLSLVGKSRFGVLVDVGCGPGAILGRLTSNSSLTVGTDISPEMLRTARMSVGNDKTEFVMAECSALPFRNEASDCVISVSLLKSDSDRSALLEMVRILKPGGTLLGTVFHSEETTIAQEGLQLPHPEMRIPLTDKETLFLVRKGLSLEAGQ